MGKRYYVEQVVVMRFVVEDAESFDDAVQKIVDGEERDLVYMDDRFDDWEGKDD